MNVQADLGPSWLHVIRSLFIWSGSYAKLHRFRSSFLTRAVSVSLYIV